MVVLYLNVILLLYIWSFISFLSMQRLQTSFRKRKVQAVTIWSSFVLRWRVNSSKTFSYSSAWLKTASGNGDKRLTK